MTSNKSKQFPTLSYKKKKRVKRLRIVIVTANSKKIKEKVRNRRNEGSIKCTGFLVDCYREDMQDSVVWLIKYNLRSIVQAIEVSNSTALLIEFL